VVASGPPAPSYQWQRDGHDIPGAASASYTTPPATLADRGVTFRALISNPLGSIASQSAALTVHSGVITQITTGRFGEAVALADGRVFLRGNTGYVTWDPATGTFEEPLGPPVQSGRGLAAETLLASGQVLITGATTPPSAEIYDPVSRTFRATSGAP